MYIHVQYMQAFHATHVATTHMFQCVCTVYAYSRLPKYGKVTIVVVKKKELHST